MGSLWSRAEIATARRNEDKRKSEKSLEENDERVQGEGKLDKATDDENSDAAGDKKKLIDWLTNARVVYSGTSQRKLPSVARG